MCVYICTYVYTFIYIYTALFRKNKNHLNDFLGRTAASLVGLMILIYAYI